MSKALWELMVFADVRRLMETQGQSNLLLTSILSLGKRETRVPLKFGPGSRGEKGGNQKSTNGRGFSWFDPDSISEGIHNVVLTKQDTHVEFKRSAHSSVFMGDPMFLGEEMSSRYCEFEVNHCRGDAPYAFIGVALDSYDTSKCIGSEDGSWAWASDGDFKKNGGWVGRAGLMTFKSGDKIGMLLNLSESTLRFTKNGQLLAKTVRDIPRGVALRFAVGTDSTSFRVTVLKPPDYSYKFEGHQDQAGPAQQWLTVEYLVAKSYRLASGAHLDNHETDGDVADSDGHAVKQVVSIDRLEVMAKGVEGGAVTPDTMISRNKRGGSEVDLLLQPPREKADGAAGSARHGWVSSGCESRTRADVEDALLITFCRVASLDFLRGGHQAIQALVTPQALVSLLSPFFLIDSSANVCGALGSTAPPPCRDVFTTGPYKSTMAIIDDAMRVWLASRRGLHGGRDAMSLWCQASLRRSTLAAQLLANNRESVPVWPKHLPPHTPSTTTWHQPPLLPLALPNCDSEHEYREAFCPPGGKAGCDDEVEAESLHPSFARWAAKHLLYAGRGGSEGLTDALILSLPGTASVDHRLEILHSLSNMDMDSCGEIGQGAADVIEGWFESLFSFPAFPFPCTFLVIRPTHPQRAAQKIAQSVVEIIGVAHSRFQTETNDSRLQCLGTAAGRTAAWKLLLEEFGFGSSSSSNSAGDEPNKKARTNTNGGISLSPYLQALMGMIMSADAARGKPPTDSLVDFVLVAKNELRKRTSGSGDGAGDKNDGAAAAVAPAAVEPCVLSNDVCIMLLEMGFSPARVWPRSTAPLLEHSPNANPSHTKITNPPFPPPS